MKSPNRQGLFRMNVGYLLTNAANRYPDRTAIVFEGRRFSYREFNERVNSLAKAFVELGVRKGDKVAAMLFNSNEIVEVYFAAAKMGGVFVPINFRFKEREASYILDHSDAVIFIYGEEFAEMVASLRSELSKVKQYVCVGSAVGETLEYEGLIAGFPPKEPEGEVTENDECQLMYTSGTTGRPKGALITHGNVLWNLVNTMIAREDIPGDISLVVGPLYHTAALNNHFTIRVALAGTSVIMRRFDPREMMETIERERINVVSGSPAAFNFLLQLPNLEGYDTLSVTKCTAGSAILPVETKNRLLEVFPNCGGVYDVYGCTETSPCITILSARDSLRKHACVGKPLLFLEAKVVDEDGNEVPVGEVGEVVCRGPTVMKGYYKDEEGTKEALKGGWLHTGDLARVDEEGFFYIVDRKKDMVISGGENIYPREIEEVLYTHPKVAEAAVIGVPDDVWGESVKALVVLKEAETMTEKEVIAFCEAHLASYKRPRSVDFVEVLPRNPSGKVLKTELRARYGGAERN
jgi:fatty-acyl-CoA synthase